jgi:DNA-binding transcriptional ArsR family regulator
MAAEASSPADRRIVTELAALKALAHPERAAILKLLMAGRPLTATECASSVDLSPSACSYHLRQLERFGFVERVGEASADGHSDGRTRRWQATAIGFSLGERPMSEATPEQRAVFTAVIGADRVENDRLIRRFVEHAADLEPAWQDAAVLSTYELWLTPDELEQIGRAVDDVLRPHRARAKQTSEPSARTVHVVFEAFPRVGEP